MLRFLIYLLIVTVKLSIPGMVYAREEIVSDHSQKISDPDLKYEFGTSEGIIDLGIQPLWLPSGVIVEVMKRDGILHRELRQRGATVRFHPFFKGAEINHYLHKGDLEGGGVGDMPAITACVHDQIRIVSLMDLNFTAIVARELMKLSDLRGQRIGYAFGSNAHYALLTALSANGVTESEVTLVPMEVDAMPLALDQGRIDAFSAWEPIPSVAAQVYGHKVIHQFLSSGYLYFSRSFAERHPEWVAQLVAAEFRALNWLEQSESHFFRAVSWSAIAIRNFQGRDFDLSRKEMMKLVRSGIHNLWTLPVIPVTDLTEEGHIGRESHFLGTIGKIPRSVPWESIKKCFHWEVGEQVLFAPARYHLNEFDVRGVTK